MNKDSIVNRFLNYVKIDSPSLFEGDFAQVIKKDLEELGFEVVFDQSQEKTGSNTGNLIARLEGREDIEPIMFSAHLDTVQPGEGIEPVIKDGLISSQGETILASDDKSGIVAIIEGIKHILDQELDHGDIEVLLTSCEEMGLRGSSHLDYSLIKSKLGLVLDGGGDVGAIFTSGPAQTQIDVLFKGRSAHAGLNPEDGISAIQVAAAAIDRMKLLRIDEETTANVGFIEGGQATNIVADRARAKFECRSLDEAKLEAQVQDLIAAINSACQDYGASSEIEVIKKYPSFSIARDHRIVRLVGSALDRMDIEPRILSTGGGSDTNIYSGQGIDSVILSTGMENVHTVDEYIKIDNLVDSARLVAEIISCHR